MTRPSRPALDHEAIARELVRALRGRRSQNGLSRRLGARSNVVHRWEAGACWPQASTFLRACALLGVDVGAAYTRILQRTPKWLQGADPAAPRMVAAFLSELRGQTPIRDLAATAGVNRFSASRWLSAGAQPNLPQFLCMIDAASGRLLDFLGALVDPRKLSALAAEFKRLERARRLAYEEPWSHAVLRALQLDACPGEGEVRFIADRLDLPPAGVRRLLRVLERAGQVRRSGGRWMSEPLGRVDTSFDRNRARAVKAVWGQVAVERLNAGAPGVFGYSLFEVSGRDMQRLRALQLEYSRAMQSIIAGSTGTERVGLYWRALLDLAAPERNALAATQPRETDPQKKP